jgi:probable HAF family extracellular repeat protein
MQNWLSKGILREATWQRRGHLALALPPMLRGGILRTGWGQTIGRDARQLHRMLGVVMLGLVLVAPSLALAQGYTFMTLDFPGAVSTSALGINNSGQIVGQTNTASEAHGFLYDRGSLSLIDVPGAVGTIATGINDSGHIVGYYFAGTFPQPAQGFVYDGTHFSSINFPGASNTFVWGINNRGQIIGSYQDMSFASHGFLYDGGNLITVDLPGALQTFAQGINDSGHIVGWGDPTQSTAEGFLYDGVHFTPIIFPGAPRNQAFGINNSGVIVGDYNLDPIPRPGQAFHGFRFAGGSFTSIDVPSAFTTRAIGINDMGQIVGDYIEAVGAPSHGFLATPLVVDMLSPVITVAVNSTTLWPPNGKLIPVTVSGTITDEPGGSEVNLDSVAYVVADEYGRIQPSGGITLGAGGSYSFTVSLEASRKGNDKDGRHYTITVSAEDNAGNLGTSSTIVTVPHDQGK